MYTFMVFSVVVYTFSLMISKMFADFPNIPLILDFEAGAVQEQPGCSTSVYVAQPDVNRCPSPYVEQPAGK